jgi:glycosyltransferase involved in cell wall biosynthesis
VGQIAFPLGVKARTPSLRCSKLRVLMVSTEYPPMRGGVGRYTSNLTKALLDADLSKEKEDGQTQKDSIDVSVICDDGGNGQFSGIHPRNSQNSQILLNIVQRIKPDIVHVQFEPGLYGLELGLSGSKRSVTNIDTFYLKCPVPIVTTFHSIYTLRQWMGQTLVVKKRGKTGNFGIPARAAVRLWKHFINYKAFINLNKQKLLQSRAGIVFSNKMFELLGGGEIIYHGAEPSMSNSLSKQQFRSYFSLDGQGAEANTNMKHDLKIALAVGFKTALKGWDIIEKMPVPGGWYIVVNSSKGYYSTENIDLKKDKIRKSQLVESKIIDLQRGFLTEEDLSRLFFASDAVLLPYKITSGSGVMFDALAHGLPFVATDLDFFKEFSDQGLGITVKRNPIEFARGLKLLEEKYDDYAEAVNRFRGRLSWNYIAKEHLKVYNRAVKAKETT